MRSTSQPGAARTMVPNQSSAGEHQWKLPLTAKMMTKEKGEANCQGGRVHGPQTKGT